MGCGCTTTEGGNANGGGAVAAPQQVLVNPKYGSQSSTIGIADNAARAAFIGYAYRDFVEGELFPTRWELITNATAVVWAELALGTGPIVLGGNPVITPVGFTDIAAQVVGGAGLRSTTLAIAAGQSIPVGTGIWAIMAADTTTGPNVSGMQANDNLLAGIQGTNTTVGWRPSLQLGVASTFTLDVVNAALRTLTIPPYP